MNVYQYVSFFNQDNTLALLVQTGVISLTVIWYLKYYEDFLIYFEKENKSTAVTFAADQNGMSDRTIYNAIKMMETEIPDRELMKVITGTV